MLLVPSPYRWFSANPAISRARARNVALPAPHTGHPQSPGRSWNCVPGGTGYSGSPAWEGEGGGRRVGASLLRQGPAGGRRARWSLPGLATAAAATRARPSPPWRGPERRQTSAPLSPSPVSSSPTLGVYSKPHPPHTASPVPTTMNFSAARKRSASARLRDASESGFWGGGIGAGSGLKKGLERTLVSPPTSGDRRRGGGRQGARCAAAARVRGWRLGRFRHRSPHTSISAPTPAPSPSSPARTGAGRRTSGVREERSARREGRRA